MKHVLEQLDRAVERCEASLNTIWPALDRVAAGGEIKLLRAVAKESRRAFEDSKAEMVPVLDAIVSHHKDPRLVEKRDELASLRDEYPRDGDETDRLMTTIAPEYVRAKADADKVASALGNGGIRGEYLVTWLRRGKLVRVAKILRYVGQYLRTRHAMQPAESPHSGSKSYSISVNNSTMGSLGAGDAVRVDGAVAAHLPWSLTRAGHAETIKTAKKALVDDEDQLDDLVREALSLFLRLARDIQVEQRTLAETRAQMKETFDEVWTQQVAKGMKPQVLPKGLEVVGALAKSEVMVEVVKKLVGG